MRRRAFLAAGAGLLAATARTAFGRAASRWGAGRATADITPPAGLWMAGFAARTGPAEGAAMPLHAKVLALQDDAGRRLALVTLDLLGITAAMRRRIASRLAGALPSHALVLSSSHTHCGPVVDDQLSVAYDLDADQRARIAQYTAQLEDIIVASVTRAMAAQEPVTLRWSEGTAAFAANRRVQFLPPGPVDHRVPVLRVDSSSGAPFALVFGYACHNTTLQAGMRRFHGDYAGVAQREIEAAQPGVAAMFVAGCGADANPAPRGTLELVEAHGQALAAAARAASVSGIPLDGGISTALSVVEVPFKQLPDAEEWRARLADADVYVRRHARLMLDRLERDGRLEPAYAEPIQVVGLGPLRFVALGGEVVADYALRLRREHASTPLWVAGYCNDVSAYVPSLRVLLEGGYEGGGAMIYYGRPGPFDPSVEERIVREADRLLSAATRADHSKGRPS